MSGIGGTGYGWAAVVDGEISVETVSPKEVAAMANALAALFNVWPRDSWSDEMIAAAWTECVRRLASKQPHTLVAIVPVAVRPIVPQ